MRERDLLAAGVAYLGLFTFGGRGKSLRSWAEAFAVWRSLLGYGGFGCGLHLGLWCGRILDLHWLSKRGLFFAGAGYCCLSCSSLARAGFCGLLARGAPLAS
jgi:hypothetical protein